MKELGRRAFELVTAKEIQQEVIKAYKDLGHGSCNLSVSEVETSILSFFTIGLIYRVRIFGILAFDFFINSIIILFNRKTVNLGALLIKVARLSVVKRNKIKF